MPLDLPGTPFRKAMKRYFMGHVTSIARAGYSVGRTRSRCDGSLCSFGGNLYHSSRLRSLLSDSGIG
nr:hypothetical protein [Tanacetum cinerariifolium]